MLYVPNFLNFRLIKNPVISVLKRVIVMKFALMYNGHWLKTRCFWKKKLQETEYIF